jgi:hypothetical protein
VETGSRARRLGVAVAISPIPLGETGTTSCATYGTLVSPGGRAVAATPDTGTQPGSRARALAANDAAIGQGAATDMNFPFASDTINIGVPTTPQYAL